jgi:hypothetical protein
MDWNNPAHALQAIFWALAFFAFAHGYTSGNRQ